MKKANDYQANQHRNMSSSVNVMFRAVQVIILPCTCSVDKVIFENKTTTESCIRCSKKQLPARAYLWNMPSILIIHLGRSKDEEKNERFVDFPLENLDISSYLHPDSPVNGLKREMCSIHYMEFW
ncbi:unnamed protein product [Meloidogyne enterolobii]|uniref:Uncharacterized protein n=1 Tax=Meloidogyne enterolobii TaxID=390850 RepID=A0ACB0XX31_MELEN